MKINIGLHYMEQIANYYGSQVMQTMFGLVVKATWPMVPQNRVDIHLKQIKL